MQFKEFQTEQKLRGGYYTPLDLAVFLSKWVFAEGSCKKILEPSCGDGVFFEAISKITRRKIYAKGFEIEKTEAQKAIERCKSIDNITASIYADDFLKWVLKNPRDREVFDGVVGNPPFVRYQYLPAETQVTAEKVYQHYGLPFKRHTNAWGPFVIASIGLLKPGGRLGMVLPAEILHVMHAQAIRHFLGKNCKRILIFDPEDIWFEKTLQGAIILLAEKKLSDREKSLGIGIVRTSGRNFLGSNPSEYFRSANYINGKAIEGKWTRALLNNDELDILDGLESHEQVFPFGKIAEVDVGLVTGANNFFLVPESTVEEYNLGKWAHPMFGRSEHCRGVIYDRKQHKGNVNRGLPTNFLWFDVASDKELNNRARAYIEKGEKLNLHKRYKCRIRTPWYKVPSVYATKIGMLKRAHNIPRLILNNLEAFTTDTAYRIKAYQLAPERLVFCFVNALTALSAELEGRHYGGGVLELVPSEIEKVVIPIHTRIKVNLRELDKGMREMAVEEVLKKQDRIILGEIGLTKHEQEVLFEAWNKLRCRRQRISRGIST